MHSINIIGLTMMMVPILLIYSVFVMHFIREARIGNGDWSPVVTLGWIGVYLAIAFVLAFWRT